MVMTSPMVARPGISTEMLDRAGVKRVSAEESQALCQLAATGLFIPYRTLDGADVIDGEKTYGRLRLEQPQGSRKYHQAAGTAVHAYLPPGLAEAVARDLFVVEGEFKSIALTEAGFPAVGVSGFFGFAEKGGEKLTPEFASALAQVKPERIFFCGDSDTALNYHFAVAAMRLASLVAPIKVLLPRIPLNGPGKGADDCRAALNGEFPAWWHERQRHAIDVARFNTAGSLVVELVRREEGALAALDRDPTERRLVALAAALERDPLAQDRLIGLAVEFLDVGRAPFKRAVAAVRSQLRKQAAANESATSGDPSEPTGVRVDMSLPNGVWPKLIYEAIADETYFYSGNLCREFESRLVPLSPATACSFVDQPHRVCPYRQDTEGKDYAVKFTETDGRILLGAWQDSHHLLRLVTVKSNVPVLAWDGAEPVLVNGYCPKTHILAGGDKMVLPTTTEAVHRLCELFRDYDFASRGDLGRAMSFALTLALTQGGFLGAGRAPLFFVEKSAPSAGGSLLIRLICHIYGLTPQPLTQIDDPKRLAEDFSSRLLAGDGLCYIDNARGKGLQNLPWFESLLTEPTFACRVPYAQGQADVTRRVVAVSTNGATLSKDLTTRTVKITINKRPDDYAWHAWHEGGIEEHAQQQSHRYLGAVFALVNDWAKAGRPRGQQLTGFRFHQWEAACAWILQKHFPGLPLLDAEHKESQKRLADPDYDFLRTLVQLVCEGETRGEITATGLAELAANAGLLSGDEKQNRMHLGKVLKRRFPEDGLYEFDAHRFHVNRETRMSATGKPVAFYSIQPTTPT